MIARYDALLVRWGASEYELNSRRETAHHSTDPRQTTALSAGAGRNLVIFKLPSRRFAHARRSASLLLALGVYASSSHAAEEPATTSAPTPGASIAQALKPKPRTLKLVGKEVAPGTRTRLTWKSGMALEGLMAPVPIVVVNGNGPGPVLCMTAAIHGDELNGIEIVRRVTSNLDPQELNGAVIGVPIVNLQGFYRGSRYLPDRRDLNRSFPGNPKGSAATRLANSFFTEIASHCSAIVDLHTGSLDRSNLAQLRADLHLPLVAKLSKGFGSTVVLQSIGEKGSLRRAATEIGIPAVTFEMGEPMRVQQEHVDHGVKAIETLLYSLGMTTQRRFWSDTESIYYSSRWVRVDHGGILFSEVALGERVSEGELLGTINDPITDEQHRVYAPRAGRILGIALNQVVLPGYAAYRIGIEGGELKHPSSEMREEDSEDDTRPD